MTIVGADLLLVGQIVEDLHARHPRRQAAAAALGSGMGGDLDQSLFLHIVVDELLCLVEQAELIAMDPLAARSEALALQQPEILAELLDFEIAFPKRGISFDEDRF